MCYAKPGNRCFAHHRTRFVGAMAKHAQTRAAIDAEVKALGGEKNLTEEQRTHFQREREKNDRMLRGVSTMYYATPKARTIQQEVFMPRAAHRLKEAQRAHKMHPRGGTRKTMAAIRNAEAEMKLIRRNITEGEKKHQEAATSYKTMRRAEAAEDNFDYKHANYTAAELSKANSWDVNYSGSVNEQEFHSKANMGVAVSNGAIPVAGGRNQGAQWRKSDNVEFNNRVRTAQRTMKIETPTQERANSVARVQIVGNNVQGYRVVSSVQSQYGTPPFVKRKDDENAPHGRKIGTAMHPQLQHEGSRIERADGDYSYTKPHRYEESSPTMGFEDAKGYANALVRGKSYVSRDGSVKLHESHLAAGVARNARNYGMRMHARANGLDSKEKLQAVQQSADAHRPKTGWVTKPE